MRPTSSISRTRRSRRRVGSGPYVIAEVQPGARLLLRRDPNYWGKDVPSQRGFYNFDEIDIDLFSRRQYALFEAFKAGLIDYREETQFHALGERL